MKKFQLFLAFSLLTIVTFAQYPPMAWYNLLKGQDQSGPNVDLTEVEVDTQGYIYLSGSFRDSLRPDLNSPGTVLVGNPTYDCAYFAKYNPNGTIFSGNRIKSRLGNIYARDLDVDRHGNIYVAFRAISADTIDFDPGPGIFNQSSDGSDIFFAKYSGNGSFHWVKRIAIGNGSTQALTDVYAIKVDSLKNIYVSGRFATTIDLDPGPGTLSYSNPGGFNCSCSVGFYVKTDSSGNLLWGKMDHYNAITTDVDVHDQTGRIILSGIPGFGGGKPFRCLSANGVGLDSLNSSNIVAHCARFDKSGNFYFSGNYRDLGSDFNWGAGTYIMGTQASYETQGFVTRYSSNRTFQWATNFNPTNDTTYRGQNYEVNVHSDGNALVTFRESDGIGQKRGFLKISSANGAILWVPSIYNSSSGISGNVGAIESASDGSIVYAMSAGYGGLSLSTMDMNPDPGITSNVPVVGKFGYFAKFGNCIGAPSIPVSINGTASLCSTTPQTYSIVAVPGATSYTWSLPAGWIGSSTTNTITVTPSANGGTIAVSANNACGASTQRTLSITFTPPPSVTANATLTTVCFGTSVTLTGGGATTYTWNNGVQNGAAFVPTSTTTYTVTGTTSGCSAMNSVTVTVNPNPIAGISPYSPIICLGQSTSLTASGGTGYAWSNGGVVSQVSLAPLATTTYTVTVTDANGCSATANSTVTVNPLPNAAVQPSGVAICPGQTTTLTASGGTGYLWSSGGTAAQISVSPATTTTYTVTVTDANSCSATANAAVNVNATSSTTINSAICSGQTYTFNNLSLTQAGQYFATLQNSLGCDSIITLNLSVNALPQVQITPLDTACLSSPAIQLNATPSGGTWTGPGVVGSMVGPASAGLGSHILQYTLTDSNNCTGVGSMTFVVDNCVGIEQGKAIGVSVFPNPTASKVWVQRQSNELIQILVTDAVGRVVLDILSSELETVLDLEDGPSGLYFVSLLWGGQSIGYKILKL